MRRKVNVKLAGVTIGNNWSLLRAVMVLPLKATAINSLPEVGPMVQVIRPIKPPFTAVVMVSS